MKPIKSNKLDTFFQELQSKLGGNFSTTLNTRTLQFDSAYGKGNVKSTILDNGISMLDVDVVMDENFMLNIESGKKSHVNFIYCSKGKMSHTFHSMDNVRSIETFQASIIANITSSKNIVMLSKGLATRSIIISVDLSKSKLKDSVLDEGLRESFIKDRTTDYFYSGSYNLKIAKYISQLKDISQDGFVGNLFTQGLISTILALEIQQHNTDLKDKNIIESSLTKSEMVLIEELTAYINENPESDLMVYKLASQIALSQAKVQEGFKMMHGLTVCEYVRNVRLRKSEELISTTDLNISEIVYSLGFTSRSYFSKIFKEHFKCSPSHYKRKIKLAVSA